MFSKFIFMGLNLDTVSYMSTWYEIWSKAGADLISEYRSLDYIKNFNWLNNWIDRYFLQR